MGIFVKNYVEARKIHLNTNLEAVAVSISCNINCRPINICNIYLPHPNENVLEDLQRLIDDIPAFKLILGDLNCHNIIWGSIKTDKCGRLLQKLIDNQNLILMNTAKPTHFSYHNSTFSAIDISLCDYSLATSFSWNSLDYLYNSDHFPLTIETIGHDQPNIPVYQKWKLNSPNWDLYRDLINDYLTNFILEDSIDSSLHHFNDTILKCANIAVGKTKPCKRKPVPWWNEEIALAMKSTKHAFNVLKRHKTTENVSNFKKPRAKTKYLIKKSKKKHGQIMSLP
ncbi:uncharacterized protein [Diabrotica undecimpunctata]|uniref:uncharacterized protein n=1 Tax=Diabrotica undecimpunctata TaxID=50387 RepID=UPI003B64031F